MSIEAYKAAWATDCAGSVKLTLLAIAEFASKKNGYTCTASIKTLANMISASPRQTKRNLATLEKLELITIERNKGRSYTNIYSINALMKGDTHDTIKEEIKVTPMTNKGDTQGRKGDTHDTLTVNNPIEPLLGDRNEVDELAQYFQSVAGVFPNPGSYEAYWIDPLQLYLENAGSLEDAKQVIKRAVDFARNGSEKRYTISSPRSIATIVANMPKEGSSKLRVAAR